MRIWVSVFLTEWFLFYLLAIHKYPSTRCKYFFRGFGFSVGWDLGLVEQNIKKMGVSETEFSWTGRWRYCLAL